MADGNYLHDGAFDKIINNERKTWDFRAANSTIAFGPLNWMRDNTLQQNVSCIQQSLA